MGRTLAVGLALGMLACSSAPGASIGEMQEESQPARALVGSTDGELAAVSAGSWQIESVAELANVVPSAVRRHGGAFYVLSGDRIAVLDAGSMSLLRSIPLAASDGEPLDLAVADESTAYLTARYDQRVTKIDLETGAVIARIDMLGLAPFSGVVELQHMTVVESRLFVQADRSSVMGDRPGAVAVIDIGTDEVEQVIELDALRPSFPMVFDAERRRLLVAVKGGAHGLGAGIAAVDIDELVLDEFFLPAQAGEQGAFVMANDGRRLFVIYHTEVPFVSSHLLVVELQEDGSVSEEQPSVGSLYDSWDGHDSVTTDAAGELVVMPDACATICAGSPGLHVFDAASLEEIATLPADDLGLAPSWVTFGR